MLFLYALVRFQIHKSKYSHLFVSFSVYGQLIPVAVANILANFRKIPIRPSRNTEGLGAN